MSWYLKVLKNYVGFQGRARRKEYWLFSLISFFVSIMLLIVEGMTDLTGVLTIIYYFATILPSLAVVVRRLHDTGRSGWWYFLSLIPLVGPIIVLVFLCQDSVENNEYGPNPKYFG